MIRLSNVGLKYDRGPEVLTDVNFHLRPGSFHFLHGESGAGKTSLLRLMFMSLSPTRGQLQMFSEDISRVSPQKRAQLRRRRRYIATTDSNHDQPIFLDRSKDIILDGPDQLWVADLTYVAISGASPMWRSSSTPGHAASSVMRSADRS